MARLYGEWSEIDDCQEMEKKQKTDRHGLSAWRRHCLNCKDRKVMGKNINTWIFCAALTWCKFIFKKLVICLRKQHNYRIYSCVPRDGQLYMIQYEAKCPVVICESSTYITLITATRYDPDSRFRIINIRNKVAVCRTLLLGSLGSSIA